MSQQYQTITLAVGESRSLNTRGRVFAVDSSTDNFQLRFNDQAEITASSKRIFGSVDSPEFSRVTLRNTSVSANTITYGISFQQIKIETSVASVIANITVAAMKHAPSTTLGSGIVALADTASSAAITNTNGKQFAVRNHTTSVGSLQIKDASGNIMDVLAPGDPPWTLETSGTFILTASGGACDYSWGKLIYV